MKHISVKNIFVDIIEIIAIVSFLVIMALSTGRLIFPQEKWIEKYIIAEPWDFLAGFLIARYVFSAMLRWAVKSKMYSEKYWRHFIWSGICKILIVALVAAVIAGPVAGAIFVWAASAFTHVLQENKDTLLEK